MLTDDRVEAIFKEMDRYVLELSSDPASMGPVYFQDIIATCRNYLNRVSLVISELNREKLVVSSELRALEASYDLDYDDLIANNDRVRTLASIEDRKSTTSFLLKDQKLKINELKDRMHTLDSVYKLVTYRNRELHSTMTAIKDQRRLLQTEVATGAFYGDERVPRGANGIGVDDMSAEELGDLLSEDYDSEGEVVSKETEEPQVEVEAEPEKNTVQEEPSDPLESEVEAFLVSPEEPEMQTPQPVVPKDKSDDEMADVLSMLDGL